MEFDQIILPRDQLQKKWYNIVPGIPGGLPPPKEPGDGESAHVVRAAIDEVKRAESRGGEVHPGQN